MANTSKNSLGYRINYREGTISVSERLIKEANRNGIGSVAHNTLEALMKMGMPIVKYRENTNARKGLTYSKMTKYHRSKITKREQLHLSDGSHHQVLR